MTRSGKQTKKAVAAVEARTGPRRGGEGRRDLFSVVDEIGESVLDAADEEILAEFGDRHGQRALGGELLQEMMLDVLGRYYARQRRAAVPASAKEAS